MRNWEEEQEQADSQRKEERQKKILIKDTASTLMGCQKMQKGKVEKTLTKPARWNGVPGVENEKQFVEYAIKNGLSVQKEENIKQSLSTLKQANAPEQWKYAKKEEKLRESDYGGFVHGTLETPLTKYLRNGDSSELSEKYKKTEYQIWKKGSVSEYHKISKTAYSYYEYLTKRR